MTDKIEVLDLSTGNTQIYIGINSRRAVIAAHAQSLGDFNTWDYAKYDGLVREGKYSFGCGNFVARK